MPAENKPNHAALAMAAAQEEITKALGQASNQTLPVDERCFILMRGLCFALNRVLQHAEKDLST